MPDLPEFSAVIPTYNRARLVGRAIESALAQEHPPQEIIVVDDGSADDTRAVVEAFGGTVRYVHQQNAGASAARNLGVGHAKFAWIAFLDSDDRWSPGHLRRVADCIRATAGRAVLYFEDTRLPESEGARSVWELCGLELNQDYELRTDASEWAFMLPQPMMLQASVISRDGYLRYGGLHEDLRTREDTLFFYQLALTGTVCAVAGCGTLMHSDDTIRLTSIHDAESLTKAEAGCRMYAKLLEYAERNAHAHRDRIRELLGSSYFCLGRVLYRRHDYAGTAKNLALAIWYGRDDFIRECAGPWARRRWGLGGAGHGGRN